MNKKEYSTDMVSRNVKALGNGVIEITRYNFGHLKANGAWIWFLGVMGVMLHDYLTGNYAMFNEMQWAISVDWALQEQWGEILRTYKDLGYAIPVNGYEEFKIGMLGMHWAAKYVGAFYILFPTVLFLWLISPKWRPLRIDSRRGLIYFWSWGRFYIQRFPPHLKTNRLAMLWELNADFFHSWMHSEEMGSLILRIPHENPNIKKRVELNLGIYRPICANQNVLLRDFIVDYLCSNNPDEEFAPYFKKENRIWRDYFAWFYHFSLFPPIGYNEKKTEKKIQEWLEKYGE